MAIKWKMILTVFVICFLYVGYDTAPKLLVKMFSVCLIQVLCLLFIFFYCYLFVFFFFFGRGVSDGVVRECRECESFCVRDCGCVRQTHR